MSLSNNSSEQKEDYGSGDEMSENMDQYISKTNIVSDKKVLITENQKKLINFKNRFVTFDENFRDIYATLLDVETKISDNLSKYVNDLIAGLLDTKKEYDAFLLEVREIDLIDDFNEGKIIKLLNVPLIQIEFDVIVNIFEEIPFVIEQVKNLIKKRGVVNEEKKGYLSYYC